MLYSRSPVIQLGSCTPMWIFFQDLQENEITKCWKLHFLFCFALYFSESATSGKKADETSAKRALRPTIFLNNNLDTFENDDIPHPIQRNPVPRPFPILKWRVKKHLDKGAKITPKILAYFVV